MLPAARKAWIQPLSTLGLVTWEGSGADAALKAAIRSRNPTCVTVAGLYSKTDLLACSAEVPVSSA